MSPPARIDAASRPRLRPGVRLQFDAVRRQWVVQAPERVLMPDEIALAVLQRCDGATSLAAIGDELARLYQAPGEEVLADIVELLQDLAGKGVIGDGRA